MKTIKVVMCKPEKKAYITEISTSLESMQKTVGGLIEFYYLADDIFIVCNDSAKIEHLPASRVIRDSTGKIIEIINGNFFIAKEDLSDDENSDGFLSLSDEEASYYLEKYLYPDDVFLIGGEIVAIPYYGAEEGDK